MRQSCPICGRGPRDKTLIVWSNGNVHCHRGCGWREIKDALGHQYQPPVNSAPEAPKQRWSAKAQAIWKRSIRLDGTPVEAYLRGRCLSLPEHDIRALQPRGSYPWSMLARITDAISGAPLSLHFTQLHSDGSKARFYLGGHTKRGGVVRLSAHTGKLCVAEGIESALAASQFEGPAWATLDAGNLATLPVVPGVESLTIFPDNDPPGLNAARQCVASWMSAGVPVQMVRWGDGTPKGWDACDELGVCHAV